MWLVAVLVVILVWPLVRRVNGVRPTFDDADDRDVVVLIVEWNPTPRALESDVRLWVDVNGLRVEDVAWRTSPWRHVIDVRPPTRVTLGATQDRDGLLRCTILRSVGGMVVDTDERWGPGRVTCDAVVN